MQRRFFYFHSPCYTVILCNFIGIAFRHWCSPVNLLHILRTSFPKNTSVLLLLNQAKVMKVSKLAIIHKVVSEKLKTIREC